MNSPKDPNTPSFRRSVAEAMERRRQGFGLRPTWSATSYEVGWQGRIERPESMGFSGQFEIIGMAFALLTRELTPNK